MTTQAATAGLTEAGPVLTLGVEEEFFLLRPDGSPAPVAPQIIAALPGDDHLHPEWMQFQVETVTGVCEGLVDLVADLETERRAVARAAADRDALMVASGTPPYGVPGLAALTDNERYRRLQDRFPDVAAEVVACGCHVHVGVPDRELGVATLNKVREWLPVLLAVSANSPMWRGRDSGWESYRHEMFRRWPSARIPPRCEDAAGYDAALDQRIAAGDAADERGVYWFARLSPHFPTLEIRVADSGLTVADTVLLAALCRALVATAVAEATLGLAGEPVPEALLERSLLNAARHGLGAVLLDPRTGVLAPGHAVLYRLVEHVAPALVAAGDRETVGGLLAQRRLHRSGAARQRSLRRGLDQEAFVAALAGASLPAGDALGRRPQDLD